MTLYPLALPPGLISDDTSFASDGRWEDASLVRFKRGKPQTVGGWRTITTDALSGVCRNVLSWTDTDGNLTSAYGTHTHLQVYSGGDLYDVTPTGLAAGAVEGVSGPGYGAGYYDEGLYGTSRTDWFPRTWALSTYGETLIANPRDGTIYQWSNDTGVVAAAVTNAPARVTYALVTPERQLLAFGCNEEVGGTWNPLCIRGSSIENITEWTTGTTTTAFEHILEGGGRIVGARLIGSYVLVWTDSSVHLGEYIGSTDQAYRFDMISANCGLIGPNAVAIMGQTAYWVAPDLQFYSMSLGSPPAMLECPIREDFRDNLAENQGAKIVASTISQFGEVWFFYPDSRDGTENSRALFLSIPESVQTPVWSKAILARTAFSDAGVVGYPIGVDSTGVLYHHELGDNANGASLEWFILSADQYIANGGKRVMVRCVTPDFEDQQGAISLTAYFKQYPQSTAVTKGPYTLAEGATKKDLLASGRIVAMKFSGASNPSFMRFGKPLIDGVPMGER